MPAIEEAIVGLTRVWSDIRLYPPTHPVIAGRLREAEAELANVLGAQRELTVKQVDGDLIHGARRLFRNQPRPAGFIGTLDRLGIGCFTFLRGVTAQELGTFCSALAGEADGLTDEAAIRRHLTEHGVSHVGIDRLALMHSEGGGRRGVSLSQLYNSAVDVARQALESARLGRRLDVASVQAVTEHMVGEITRDSSTAMGLACLRGHDEYSFAHSVHTALLALALGDYIGLTESELRQVGAAAILHDVGKAVVPVDVLRKPGKLSDQDWGHITRHPAEGASMLLDYDGLPAVAPIVALEHHIGCDREGYPAIKGARDLSFVSHIVALVDVYDALTTHRPYRPPLPPKEALEVMAGMAGGKLDRKLLEWFRSMLGVYPPASCVVLESGEIAVVCGANPDDPERPLVTIVTNAAGERLEMPQDVDLTEMREGRHAYSIRGSLSPAQVGVEPSAVIDDWLARQAGDEADEE
jgi:HD-GYP domain-containing protein (c-di-GMP phosphodiesterase class II)